MAITPVNCAEGQGCIIVGRDLASATPGKLIITADLDDIYTECDVNGLRVKIRDQPADINAAALPAPAQGCGNLLRAVNQAGNKGMFAFAPQIHPRGDGARVTMNLTLEDYSAISHTISYTNPDTGCARIVAIDCTLSTIVEEGGGAAIPIFAGVMEGLSNIADVNGNTIKKYGVTLTGQGPPFDGSTMNDARHARTYFEVPPLATVTQTWRMRTIRTSNAILGGADRGFLVFDAFAEVQQGVVL